MCRNYKQKLTASGTQEIWLRSRERFSSNGAIQLSFGVIISEIILLDALRLRNEGNWNNDAESFSNLLDEISIRVNAAVAKLKQSNYKMVM